MKEKEGEVLSPAHRVSLIRRIAYTLPKKKEHRRLLNIPFYAWLSFSVRVPGTGTRIVSLLTYKL